MVLTVIKTKKITINKSLNSKGKNEDPIYITIPKKKVNVNIKNKSKQSKSINNNKSKPQPNLIEKSQSDKIL